MFIVILSVEGNDIGNIDIRQVWKHNRELCNLVLVQ
jgi:hypothetical protein